MRHTILLAFLLGFATLTPAAAGDEEGAPPPKVASPPPLTMRLEPSGSTAGYGAPVALRVAIHNPGASPTHVWWDQRVDGVLSFEFVDQDGLVWTPVQPRPAVLLVPQPPQRNYELLGATPWHPSPLRIAAGQTIHLPLRIESFVLRHPAPGRAEARWLRALPPGHYTLRARYEKKDALIPLGKPKWSPRLLQLHPTVTLRPFPGLWTGRLSAEARLEVTAPQRVDVDALRKRVQTLEARNRALRKQLDAIREILQKR